MIRSRIGAKALVLCGLVVGLMAFATGGVAQAETGAKWTYINPTTQELKSFDSNLLPLIEGKIEGASASLDFTTKGGTNVSFTCTAFSLTGSPVLLANGSISEGSATFTGCETFLNGVLSKNCLPKTSGAALDEIKTNKAIGLLQLHTLVADGKKHHVVTLLPVTKNAKGEELAATLELGATCAIGESVEITGSLVVWDCKNEGLTHLVEHLIEEFPALKLLKALGQPAKILGSAFAFLGGAHKGIKWAGLTTT